MKTEIENWADGYDAGFAAYREDEADRKLRPILDSDLNSECTYTRGFAAGYRAAAEEIQ